MDALETRLYPVSDKMRDLEVVFQERFDNIRHLECVLSRANDLYFGGLSVDGRLLIYRQVTGLFDAYAFPVWIDISSQQMKRLWLWERKLSPLV